MNTAAFRTKCSWLSEPAKGFTARLLVLGTLLAATAAPAADVLRLPSVPLRDSAGGPPDLRDWTDRPMVVNVWATWCPPCRREMPALQALGDKLEAHGIRVVTLSVDEDANLVREFLLKYDIRLPSPIARTPGEVYRALDAMALPVTFYIRRDGVIVNKVIGARPWDEEASVQEVLRYLGTPPAAGKPR